MTEFDKIKKAVDYEQKTKARGSDGNDISFPDALEAIEKSHEHDIDPRNNRPRFWGRPGGHEYPLRVIGEIATSAKSTVLRVFNAFPDSAKKHRPPER
jgi:hypothetical protein